METPGDADVGDLIPLPASEANEKMITEMMDLLEPAEEEVVCAACKGTGFSLPEMPCPLCDGVGNLNSTDSVCGIAGSEPPKLEAGCTWKRLRVTMDPGLHVDVMLSGELPHVKATPCTGARRGRRMIAANGRPIPESGEKRIRAVTEDGMAVDWPFIAGGVKKALKSTAIPCDDGDGHWVIHTARGGWIVNVKTRQKIAFTRLGNSYFLDVWIRVPIKKSNAMEVDEVAQSGFTQPSPL